MYVLHNVLQQGHKISKWEARSCIAIYIGPSLNHAANVGLVLSLSTSLVSPTFHTKYDDNFVTVQQRFGEYLPKSYWQFICGFKSDPALGVSWDKDPHVLKPDTPDSVDTTQEFSHTPDSIELGLPDIHHDASQPQESQRETSQDFQREPSQ
jgi:hypothetical protein